MTRRTLQSGVAAAVMLLAIASARAGERVQITILSTTDLHGHLNPTDYYTNRPAQLGLAKVGTLIRRVRQENPNVLLLDSGDTIQGSPVVYYHNRINNEPPHPMMVAMNALGYDALAIGNHEYNFGLEVLRKARSEAKFPWLSANTYRVGTDEPAFAPYLIKEIAGVRVAVVGLTTPGIPNWEDARHYEGLEFRDGVAAAKRWVAFVRERERADLVVVAMHMGLERDLKSGVLTAGELTGENAAIAIAEQVPGIDVMLMGHTHRPVAAAFINGVLLAQANRWGDRLARVDVFLDKTAGADAGADAEAGGGRWRVAAKTGQALMVDAGVAPDPEIVGLVEPYERGAQVWLNQALGESAKELTARESRLGDTAIMDLIHRVQLEAGKADVSIAASFNLAARIPRGSVAVRDLYGLYLFENTLIVVEATGRQVKDALEFSAHYFRPYVAGRTPAELIDPKIPGYNFDMAEGVDYTLDLTRPAGERIVDLRFRGEPLAPEKKLRVAINNYRHNGGGGYTMFRESPVLYRSGTEIRDLIIDWVREHRAIPAEPTGNWRIATEAAR